MVPPSPTQGPRPARAAPCRLTAYRDWPERDESIHSLCSQSLAWRATPFVPFPLNQHRSGQQVRESHLMLTFTNRILMVGFGAVARCTLPILLRHISVDSKKLTIMDFEPNMAALEPWIEQGVTFVKVREIGRAS